jgi:hypothetical protein
MLEQCACPRKLGRQHHDPVPAHIKHRAQPADQLGLEGRAGALQE